MKRFLFLFSVLALCMSSAGQNYQDLFANEEASALHSVADSVAATKTEADLAAFVSARLRSSGVELFETPEYTSFGLQRENGDTATFHNVIGWIPGYEKQLRNNYIVLGTRLASDNGSGLASMMDIARKLSTNHVLLGRSVIVAAFGGASESNAGSWYFLNRAFSETAAIDAYINIDLFDSSNRGLFIYSASNADMNHLVANLSSTLQPVQPSVITAEPGVSDHRSFYAGGIPVAFFCTAEAGKPYRRGTDPMEYEEMSRQCEYIYNFAVSLSNGRAPRFLPNTDETGVPLVPFADCDTRPTFFGSSNPALFLTSWVYVYLRYPQYAVDNGIKGRVQVSFVIDEKGKVRDVKVVKGVHPSLDEEAVRVIEASPDWKPGILGGKPVRTRLSLYVEFKLKKNK